MKSLRRCRLKTGTLLDEPPNLDGTRWMGSSWMYRNLQGEHVEGDDLGWADGFYRYVPEEFVKVRQVDLQTMQYKRVYDAQQWTAGEDYQAIFGPRPFADHDQRRGC